MLSVVPFGYEASVTRLQHFYMRNLRNFGHSCQERCYETSEINSAKKGVMGNRNYQRRVGDPLTSFATEHPKLSLRYISSSFCHLRDIVSDLSSYFPLSCTSMSLLLLLRSLSLSPFGGACLKTASKILLLLKPQEPHSFLTESLSHTQ